MQAEVEVNDCVGILAEHELEFVEQRRIAHRLGGAEQGDVGLVFKGGADIGCVTHGDRVANEKDQREIRPIGSLGLE
jgi:hypothetical protein